MRDDANPGVSVLGCVMVRQSKIRFEDRCLSRVLQRLRVEKGLTLAAVATHLETSYQQIQKYETNANRVMFTTFLGLAKALGCTPQELLQEVEAEMASASGQAN
ncbi:helix-turn-helix domain-containing protein [Aureimonas leprariae]|nr:helix-turn-helix transcriptional regulator [Aureimonas leprariae]